MRKVLMAAGWLVVAVAVASCGTVRTNTDIDKGFDFSSWHTYGWDNAEAEARPAISRQVRSRLTASINEALQRKGFVYAPGAQADFLVSLEAKTNDRMADPGRIGGIGNLDAAGREENEGTLVIAMRDRRSGDVVWSGTAKSFIGGSADAEKMMLDNVDKLIAGFPPSR